MSTYSESVAAARDILSRCRCVMIFAGAGLSAESGVPTFRDQGGLWEQHRVEDVATPEGFRRDPCLVWRFYAGLQTKQAPLSPNPGHYAIAQLEQLYPQFLLVTQNVDQLSERAGSRKIVKIHGDLMAVWCTRCSWQGTLKESLDPEKLTSVDVLPHCPDCGSLARPGIVWFGEYLPAGTLEASLSFAHRADALIVVGTSGYVSGGYGLAETTRAGGGRVIEVNPSETYLSDEAHVCVRAGSGRALPEIIQGLTGPEQP